MSSTEQDAENQTKLEQVQIRFDEIKAKLIAAEQKVATLTSEYADAMAEDTWSEEEKEQKVAEIEFTKKSVEALVESYRGITVALGKAKAKLRKNAPLLKATDFTRIDTHYSKIVDKDGHHPVIYSASHPDAADTVEDEKVN